MLVTGRGQVSNSAVPDRFRALQVYTCTALLPSVHSLMLDCLLSVCNFLAVYVDLKVPSLICVFVCVFVHECVLVCPQLASSSFPKVPLKGATLQKVIHVQFHHESNHDPLLPFYAHQYKVKKEKITINCSLNIISAEKKGFLSAAKLCIYMGE